MYIGDVPTDKLRIDRARLTPGAKLFRDASGRLFMSHGDALYQWNPTQGGLSGMDGFFSKITKTIKKVAKRHIKLKKKILRPAFKVHNKVTAPAKKFVKKNAGVIAAVGVFIPVVGWAIAAAATVIALREKRKKAKSAKQAAELDERIAVAENDAEEKRIRAEQEGYDKEYAAEMAKLNAAQDPNAGQNYAMQYGGGGSSGYSGGGGGYSGEGFATNESVAKDFEPIMPDEIETEFDYKKLLIPAAIGAAVLFAMRKR